MKIYKMIEKGTNKEIYFNSLSEYSNYISNKAFSYECDVYAVNDEDEYKAGELIIQRRYE